MARQIEPDGYLVLGAAETVVGLTERLQAASRSSRHSMRQTASRRAAAALAAFRAAAGGLR